MEKTGTNGILSRFLALVSKETGIPVGQLSLGTKIESLVADSLEFLSLVSEMKQHFDSDIPNAMLTEVVTLEDLYGAIRDYIPAREDANVLR